MITASQALPGERFMLNFLPPLLVGLIASALMAINALFWVPAQSSHVANPSL